MCERTVPLPKLLLNIHMANLARSPCFCHLLISISISSQRANHVYGADLFQVSVFYFSCVAAISAKVICNGTKLCFSPSAVLKTHFR